jgi:aldose 1-epimerase
VSSVARASGPAGPVVRLGDDHLALEILPDVGARIHRLRHDGRDLIRTPPDVRRHLDDPWFWGSYPMAPWCNRVEPGQSSLAGHELDLPVNFRDGTSIHGQVSQAPWRHVEDGTFRIRAGGDGWPWPYEVEQRFSVEGDVLRLDLDLTNLGDDAMPAGIGFHPWWVKPLEVAFAAERVHRSNLATDPEPVPVDGPWDRRELALMPDDLDATWVDIGEPPIRLAWPAASLAATITFDAPTRFVTAASPSEIDAVAVEPQTHAPAAIRRFQDGEPGGLRLLDPGETLALAVRVAFGPRAG